MSSSTKTGKALAHRIAVANRAHAISGALLNIGKLVGLAIASGALLFAGAAAVVANPGMAAVAAAVCVAAGLAAVAYLAVTGVSIRDLYKSCKQVIQVKEEGLVTVQSLQPVLTPITPIAGKVGCDEIGDAEGALDAEDVASIAKAGVKVAKDTAKIGVKIANAIAVGGLAVGVGALDAAIVGVALAKAGVVAGVAGGLGVAGLTSLAAIGAVGLVVVAGAYVYKRKTAQKAAQKAATFGIELAKGGGAITEAAGVEAVEAYAREAVEDAAGNVVEAQLGAQGAKSVGGVGGGELEEAAAIGTGAQGSVKVGAKIGAAVEIAKASTSNSDVMKSLAGEKDFLEAGAELAKAIASAQDWEPVVGNVATVAQQSRAR